MALIKCHECGNDVSTLAKTCPKCGAPISTSSKNVEEITTVQLTSKKLKKQGCIYPIVLIVIALMLSRTSKIGTTIGAILLFIAIIIFFVTQIQIWWHHK